MHRPTASVGQFFTPHDNCETSCFAIIVRGNTEQPAAYVLNSFLKTPAFDCALTESHLV